MSLTIHEASAPVFINALRNMRSWMDKALTEKPEAGLLETRLVPDMRPFPAQIQMASDTAKNAMARLAGIAAPVMPDTEASFAELKARCDKTIAFVESIGPDALAGSEDREVLLKFPGGTGYQFSGRAYLTTFALPNFFFHVTTAYALLRAAGVSIGKPDFLMHLGPPNWHAEG